MPNNTRRYENPNDKAFEEAKTKFPSKLGVEVLSGQIKALKLIILLGADEARRQTPINDTDIRFLQMAQQPLRQAMFKWGWEQVLHDFGNHVKDS